MSPAPPSPKPTRSSGARALWRPHWPRLGVIAGETVLFAAIGCASWLLWHQEGTISAVWHGFGWRTPPLNAFGSLEWRSPGPSPRAPDGVLARSALA